MSQPADHDPAASPQAVVTDDAVLKIEHVSKTFVAGRRRIDALQNVTLRVHAGAVTGLIGPDGAVIKEVSRG